MKVIAHRGAVNEALENSFTAFDLAIEAGSDRLELDVHLTQDGEVIVMHDFNLLRTTGVNRKLSELTRSETKQLSLKNNDPIPFLDEVLDRYLGKAEINIELKGADPALGTATAALVKRHPKREQIIVSSFEAEPLLAVRGQADVALACLISSPVTWPLSGLASPINFMQRIGASIIHPCTRVLDDNFMDQAIRRKWTVYSYSELENSEEEQDADRVWTALMAWGVHGHCTNTPRQFKQWLTRAYGHEIVHKEAEQQVDG